MNDLKQFLLEKITEDGTKHFGLKDQSYLLYVASNWHDDHADNGRWKEVESHQDHNGKILDMAAGVGTFVLYGLHKGYDVYGVEPETWKLDYIKRKVKANNYPYWYNERIVQGVGEALPFPDNYFDYVTSYQTLEHVQDVGKCIDEMLRVLKPGGKLKLQAPDYRSWYEPHYLLPFMPKMNLRLARIYLTLLRRPTSGLATLKWTTTPNLLQHISQHQDVSFIDLTKLYTQRKIKKIQSDYAVPALLAKLIYALQQTRFLFRQERQINLVINKSINSGMP
ncbi:class I SAM-dependent methyltransferase [Rheinheimera sp. KL1]|uniref:class I SAM-dependent methyltransferase n=1 Tax=Rheinheimera sp. KL1 TaxID=1635005 RepID=UPI0006A95DC4|nr:class I SAM-dependent methyltransferase [Rheinheimera sp. KL1]